MNLQEFVDVLKTNPAWTQYEPISVNDDAEGDEPAYLFCNMGWAWHKIVNGSVSDLLCMTTPELESTLELETGIGPSTFSVLVIINDASPNFEANIAACEMFAQGAGPATITDYLTEQWDALGVGQYILNGRLYSRSEFEAQLRIDLRKA